MLKAYIKRALRSLLPFRYKLHSISHLSTSKQECSFIPFHKSHAIAFRVLADACHSLFFVLEKYTKNANASMHLLNPLQAPKVILFIPFSHTLAHTT
jgi:hypothetical protein